MASATKNMTTGSPAKLILLFALPLMVGNVFQQLYTVVDTIVVGNALGIDALAAVGNGEWLNWLVLSMIQGFAQGFCIQLAQDFGAGDYKQLPAPTVRLFIFRLSAPGSSWYSAFH